MTTNIRYNSIHTINTHVSYWESSMSIETCKVLIPTHLPAFVDGMRPTKRTDANRIFIVRRVGFDIDDNLVDC